MLSVPTLWTVFIINFLALGLIWAYVMRCYPSFEASRFWTGSAFAAAAGAAMAMLRVVFPDSLVPLLFGGTALLLAICLAAMGVRNFFDRPVSWRDTVLTTGLGFAGLSFFIFVYDSVPGRMTVFTIAQVLPMVLSLKLLLSPHQGRVNPGARLAGVVTIMIMAIFAARLVGALTDFGGGFSYLHFSPVQSVVILVLVFLSMALNFGFLLMAMDRLRNEVADLALLDDLTGVGNRRYLLQRLTEECARSVRSNQPFALLVIDLDGFKGINDTHGHAAGDACLQHFTLMAQTRLRPSDMLARTGGDEFCIVLPSSTLREGAMIARRVLEVCRADAEQCTGNDIPVAVSIGVAQWTSEIGAYPDRLIAAADHALYDAKKAGRNGFADLRPGAAAGARTREPADVRTWPCASAREACYPGPSLDFAHEFSLRSRPHCSSWIFPRAPSRKRPISPTIARASGTPEIPGLKMVWLAPWGELSKAHPWRNIIVHQTEGPAGSARGGAQAQSKNPTRRGVMVWVETDGTVYWAVAEHLVPTHGDGANRNDNKYIDNGPTYRQVVGNNSVGVEFAGNFPDVTRGPTEAQIAAWKILVKVLRARYGIPLDRVYAHNWIDYKDARYCEGCQLATMAREWGE